MASFKALYGRRYRSPIGWFEVGEAELLGPDLVYHAMEEVKLIQERLKKARSRQKSYTDIRRRDFEFQVNDWCMGDWSSVVQTDSIIVNDSLTYEEVPVEILDLQVRKLRMKEVASVK
ncbi:uncharacterized protein LOC132043301, partial [Lycium ferocissimum]|uniref:uncharacterized protein LOC132043301 n=1 Tax=Lycium ferocissimum TaxID=112874 RepID=UPI002816841C